MNAMTIASLEHLAKTWHAALDAELEGARAFRRFIHANPEVSGDELATREHVAERLELPLTPVADTGGFARIGPDSGPSIALRAELDALPVTERTGVEWAADNGAMHACGHDVHMAALTAVLRAARTLDLPFGLVGLFQPREETYPSGAQDMCAAGALERDDVRHVIGAHVHPSVARGAVSTGAGAVNAASSELRVTVRGQGGHGAYPHQGNDVAHAVAQLVVGLAEVVRRTTNPMQPALISVGSISVGEGAANVLPAEGSLAAMVRSMGDGDDARLEAAVRRYVEHTAESFGVTAEVTWSHGEPVLSNAPELVAMLNARLPSVGLEIAPTMRSLGADDFSFFGQQVPSVMCFVGVDSVSEHPAHSLHDPHFLPDEEAVDRVARTLVCGYLAAAERLAGMTDAE